MNILIYKDNQKHGPYSREDIEKHLKSGAFTRDDPAWTEGQSDWKPLSEVLDGSAPSSTPRANAAEAATPANEDAARSVPQAFTESLFNKAKATARLTQKQAYRKKLELVELRQAHQLLGKKAYDGGFFLAEHGEITSQIDLLRQEIANLQQEEHSNPASSFTEKAKGVANSATKAAKIEALTLKHNQLLAELGGRLRDDPRTDSTLSIEINAAKSIHAIIQSLDEEIENLASKTYQWARRPFLVACILAAVFVAYIGFGWVRGAYVEWATRREINQRQEKIDREQVRILAEMRETNRLAVENLEKRQKEKEFQAAQQKLEQQKREIERQEEAMAKQLQADAEKRQRVLEQDRLKLEQDRQKMLANAESAAKAELAKKQEQQQRLAFAADQFSRISIEPQVALSPRLRHLNASIEVRGKDLDMIKALLLQRDYLKLISHLRGKPFAEYPPVSEIESAIGSLVRNGFTLLLKTNMSDASDNMLCLIKFPVEYQTVEYSTSWKRHPDGIGYLHDWKITDNPIIVFAGDYRDLSQMIYSFNDIAKKKHEAIRVKMEIGEIDETTYQEMLLQVRNETYKSVRKWAVGD